MQKETDLLDREGKMIQDQDWVCLGPNITADDSFGSLPNGWTFDETDIFQVFYDEKINNWGLKLDVQPDTPYNIKYTNHAYNLLHGKAVTIVKPPKN